MSQNAIDLSCDPDARILLSVEKLSMFISSCQSQVDRWRNLRK